MTKPQMKDVGLAERGHKELAARKLRRSDDRNRFANYVIVTMFAGIAERTTHQSLMKCYVGIVKDLYASVVLSVGTTTFAGIGGCS